MTAATSKAPLPIVEGIRLQITYESLKAHLVKRAKYHEQRGKHWLKKAEEAVEAFNKTAKERIQFETDLQEEEEGLGGGGKFSSNYVRQSTDPGSNEMGIARTHRNKYVYFMFIADHLIEDRMYELQETDLTRLELASNYF